MGSQKRPRHDIGAAAETPIAWKLPADLLLEIAGRSDPCALVRFAATCKLLRRDLLSTSFIRRLSQGAAANYIIALCPYNDKPFTLVHPTTSAAASLCQDHLFPFFSHHATGLFDKYTVKTSRNGLVLLYRDKDIISDQLDSDQCSDLCVYDPMSGSQSFLSSPPDMKNCSILSYRDYIILTAADAIGLSFIVLVADFGGPGIEVHTTSSSGTWRSSAHVRNHNLPWWSVKRRCGPVVLHGGVIHWLVSHDKPILSCDFRTRKLGSVELPPTKCEVDQLHLVTSMDGKLLKLLSIEGFKMSVWLHLPTSLAGGCTWLLETTIDTEEKMRSLYPDLPFNDPSELIVFDGSGDVVLLGYDDTITVFDLETRDMHRQERDSTFLEINLPSHLHNMKIFP